MRRRLSRLHNKADQRDVQPKGAIRLDAQFKSAAQACGHAPTAPFTHQVFV